MKDIIQPFIKATKTCFETLMQVVPEHEEPQREFPPLGSFHIVTSLALVGESMKVHSILCMSRDVAKEIAENTLVEGSIDSDEELCDAVGEVINIIGGNAKGFLKEYHLDLSIPFTISGVTSPLSVPESVELTHIVFHLPDIGDFSLCVGLESLE